MEPTTDRDDDTVEIVPPPQPPSEDRGDDGVQWLLPLPPDFYELCATHGGAN